MVDVYKGEYFIMQFLANCSGIILTCLVQSRGKPMYNKAFKAKVKELVIYKWRLIRKTGGGATGAKKSFKLSSIFLLML